MKEKAEGEGDLLTPPQWVGFGTWQQPIGSHEGGSRDDCNNQCENWRERKGSEGAAY